MTPLVKRTWAPIGKTPIIRHVGRSYKKVSAIAAVAVTSKYHKPRLLFKLHKNKNIDKVLCLEFLKQIKRHIHGRIILVWDKLMVHRAREISAFAFKNSRFEFIHFPSYAPELNPVEYLWAYIKSNPLANFTPYTDIELLKATNGAARKVCKKQNLLKSFLKQSGLFF